MLPRIKLRAWPIVAIATIGLAVSGWYRISRPTSAKLVEKAEAVLAGGDEAGAAKLLDEALESAPDLRRALLPAARIAARQQRWQDALAYYDRIPLTSAGVSVNAHVVAGNILLLQLHRLAAAESRFRRVLAIDRDNDDALTTLLGILAITGRAEETGPFVLELIAQDRVKADHLLLLTNPWGGQEDAEFLRRCREAVPDDPTVLLGLGWHAQVQGRIEESRTHYQSAVRLDPNLMEAQIRLGMLLSEAGRESEFVAWHNRLPPRANDWARIWYVRGTWAERQGEFSVAIRCFWEAARRMPELREAYYRLAQRLTDRGETRLSRALLEHSRTLEAVRPVDTLLAHRSTGQLDELRELTSNLIRLGRIREARAWTRLIEGEHPDEPWVREQRSQLHAKLGTGRIENPAAALDLSGEPLPEWNERPESPLPRRPSMESIAFEDRAERAGLSFQWLHTGDAGTRGLRMFEFTGGGVGVLDYDNDSWPDIYFAQGADRPGAPAPQPGDKLFRNIAGETYLDVTAQAGLGDAEFSQGVAVGDYDNDGFPDLYVGNIGPNRMYANNGDGTFTAVALERDDGDVTANWTTSCLLADVDGDGFPDLYDVNYLGGDDVLDRICRDRAGGRRLCLPYEFPASQDRLRLSNADGSFRESTASSGFLAPDGKGLGAALANFTGNSRLELFITNDAVANFYFEGGSKNSEGDSVFANRAASAGLAFDGLGRSEGCMGIAVGDADGDGMLDLFVTNFFTETNTLYLQRQPGQFEDATIPGGLADSSRRMLGFGTQFVDADLDGRLDLLVANGHVDDIRDRGVDYHMRPQHYYNLGKGRFVEVGGEGLGSYFRKKHLGRALARLDWNRDGKEDAVVTHLDTPAALLTNVSGQTGHFLAVELRGVRSGRDAIGTIVAARLGERTIVRQLTAGDGYLASNERLLIFGLGDEETVDELRIDWPRGASLQFVDVPAGRRYLVIEEVDRLLRVPISR